MQADLGLLPEQSRSEICAISSVSSTAPLSVAWDTASDTGCPLAPL